MEIKLVDIGEKYNVKFFDCDVSSINSYLQTSAVYGKMKIPRIAR